MNTRRIFSIFLITLLMMSATIMGQAQSNKLAVKKTKMIVGTWIVKATFTEPAGIPPIEVLITFMPGRDAENDGTLIDTNEFELTPGPICTPDQGVWQRTGDRTFLATHKNYCFDTNAGNAPAGPTLIYTSITLSDSGDEFTGSQYIEGYDTGGNVVFVGKVNLSGTRMKVVAAPAQ